MPLVFHAQHALLEDMYYSLVLAFGLIWLVMSYVFADFSGGLLAAPQAAAKALWLGALAMLPNLFPIVVVFGVMGWLDWPADIGSTMTACVALGIAVDDTLHFLAWYRRQTAKGDASTLAIRHSFQHCGQAMIQTTIICGFGMLVFGLSGFMPTRRFSVLMFTLLSAALVADLVFLPAILASPLGRLFAVRGAPQPAEQDAAA
jgi:predicted RND superfamily exporter protein